MIVFDSLSDWCIETKLSVSNTSDTVLSDTADSVGVLSGKSMRGSIVDMYSGRMTSCLELPDSGCWEWVSGFDLWLDR